jgi:hypothetical protein
MVGQHLFEHSVMGILKEKTRVIVLNSHLHLLSRFDHIIVLQEHHGTSRIAAMGSFDQIAPRFPDLVQFNGEQQDHALLDKATDLEQPVPAAAAKDLIASNGRATTGGIQAEDRALGEVEIKTYVAYFDAGNDQKILLA